MTLSLSGALSGLDRPVLTGTGEEKASLARQDVARWCKRMNLPMNPPPITTDPTRAAAASFYAEAAGKLSDYIIHTMDLEWAEGVDIGQTEALEEIAKRIGLDPASKLWQQLMLMKTIKDWKQVHRMPRI